MLSQEAAARWQPRRRRRDAPHIEAPGSVAAAAGAVVVVVAAAAVAVAVASRRLPRSASLGVVARRARAANLERPKRELAVAAVAVAVAVAVAAASAAAVVNVERRNRQRHAPRRCCCVTFLSSRVRLLFFGAQPLLARGGRQAKLILGRRDFESAPALAARDAKHKL